MKKMLILAMALVAGICANAQESFAPEKGDFSTEVQFNPFNSGDYTFKLDALKFRYFVSDNDALLLDFGINGKNQKNVPDTEHSGNYSSGYHGDFKLNIGYERHFYNYKRLDLYAGAKLGLAHNFAGSKEHAERDNYEYTKQHFGKYGDYVKATGFNFGIFTGLDFYVYKGLFVGVELGFTMTDMFPGNVKTEVTTITNGIKDVQTTESKLGGHDFTFTTSVQPLVRLGWKF